DKLGNLCRKGIVDNQVFELMLNPDQCLWFLDKEKGNVCVGKVDPTDSAAFVHALAQYNNKFLNEETPFMDSILPFNGERINVTIPPISESVSFNIRKKAKQIFTLDQYIELGIMTIKQKETLVCAIRERKNILVCGSPGSGKTTLTNALLESLSCEIENGHRVLILEQVPELQCRVSNLKTLYVSDTISMQTLLWIAMRNAPDRIVVGEVRDGAALDLLKAWNTGCPGGVATIHANHPRAAIRRVLDLACEVVASPPIQLAAEALDIIVHIESRRDHPARRCISEIISVDGFDQQTNDFRCETLC
ncbi:MAG: P-type conjugative transfer ATPase TrbB, partial [Candidatus Marinimicrobia bacterium]|nr:P-type conjugative transfer ATPase TrbB [Candidatus Neomarinimicrobiota bacterium]